ncbi:cytochrome c [Ideonella sp. 4Y16]|uniref:c-type cytochrome n=1 Tax=Ideonella alba TaxID=2824118 RepID=UPI001B3755C0|nr:cytochrome c [Ideonella alba]MBQ0944596.1 cytochrome c [Ideonella alba]
MTRALILAAALTAAAPLQAQEAASAVPAASAAPAVPSAEAGRRAYTSTCARCHGINLAVTSSAYFDLRTFPKDEKERFIQSVTNGKRQMPAWGGIVKPETMESIWLYIGSVNGW